MTKNNKYSKVFDLKYYQIELIQMSQFCVPTGWKLLSVIKIIILRSDKFNNKLQKSDVGAPSIAKKCSLKSS